MADRRKQDLRVASRVASMRDRVADQARSDLARHDVLIQETEAALAALWARRNELERMLSPECGERLDRRLSGMGDWASINLERAILAKEDELNRHRADRHVLVERVHKLAVEAERTKTIREKLEKDVVADDKAKATKNLDAVASERTFRKRKAV